MATSHRPSPVTVVVSGAGFVTEGNAPTTLEQFEFAKFDDVYPAIAVPTMSAAPVPMPT